MNKVLNILMLLIIITFICTVFIYYSSNKNLDTKDFNRDNADEILRKKISDLPVLASDTDKVIEFNDSFNDEIKPNKSRSFWNLMKQ